MIRRQNCKDCLLFKHLTKSGIVDEELDIMWGKYKGQTLYFNRYNYHQTNIVLDNKLREYNNQLTSKLSKYYTKEYFKLDNINYFKILDRNINLIVISIILKYIMDKRNYPNIDYFLYSYICENKLIIIRKKYEFEDISNLKLNPIFREGKKLSRTVIKDIITQLVIFFKLFSSFYFCHNEGSINFLKFSSEYINLNLGKHEYSSSIKVYVTPSCYSSISIYNRSKNLWARYSYNSCDKYYHYYPYEKIDIDFNSSKNYNSKKFKIPYSENYLENRIIFYKIGKRSDDFIFIRRNYGSPVGSKSFDIACFIVSLLLEDYFLYVFEEDEFYLKLWEGMWKKDEKDKIWNEIKNQEDNNFEIVYNILIKYHIRFDLLDYLYNYIFTN